MLGDGPQASVTERELLNPFLGPVDALCSSFMWCVGDVWCIYGVCSTDAFASLRLWKFHNEEILGELVTLSDTL